MFTESRMTSEGAWPFGWFVRPLRIRRSNSFRFRNWMACIFIGAASLGAARSGEAFSDNPYQPVAPILSFFLPQFCSDSAMVAPGDGLSLGGFRAIPEPNSIWGANGLFQTGAGNSLAAPEALLKEWRQRSSSLFSSAAWTTIHPGIGELLPNDRIGRSRTNGAGIQDPACLYVKMTFRF
jgi:hypothetical protein